MLQKAIIENVDASYTNIGKHHTEIHKEDIDLDGLIAILQNLQTLSRRGTAMARPKVTTTGSFGRITFELDAGRINFSKHNNLNQQNIPIEIEQIPEMLGYKGPVLAVESEPEATQPAYKGGASNNEVVKLVLALVCFSIFAVIAYLFFNNFTADNYEPPEYTEIRDDALLAALLTAHAGRYANSKDAGEALAVVSENGLFSLYQLDDNGEAPEQPEESQAYRFVHADESPALLLVEEEALIELTEASIILFGEELAQLP